MPELPDIVIYLERLEAFVAGQPLEQVRLQSPFLLRSVDPPLGAAEGRLVRGFSRMGKRIVMELEQELFLVLHLMIAGRLRWTKRGVAVPKRGGLLALDFSNGTLILTEASSQKRASLHVVGGRAGLEPFDRGGVEPLEVDANEFEHALRRENRTLKRALTDPRLVSGIGNAYSDEILHRARLSPVKRTAALSGGECQRLHAACQAVLKEWLDRLRGEVGDGFPDRVTAFHDEMAVHGRYRQPCPVCGTAVQRIRHAQNEVNYCPRCQTDGRVLADRGLSRLLKQDWPRRIEELEERLGSAKRR